MGLLGYLPQVPNSYCLAAGRPLFFGNSVGLTFGKCYILLSCLRPRLSDSRTEGSKMNAPLTCLVCGNSLVSINAETRTSRCTMCGRIHVARTTPKTASRRDASSLGQSHQNAAGIIRHSR